MSNYECVGWEAACCAHTGVLRKTLHGAARVRWEILPVTTLRSLGP
jgi:hypothetical protein